MNYEEYEVKHLKQVRGIAPECMVLLKKDEKFPLKKAGKIALYGSGARNTIRGGRGSGDVNVKHFSTIEEGLDNAGFTVTTREWLDSYDRAYEAALGKFKSWLSGKTADEGMDRLMENLGIVMPEPEYDISLQGDGDTAVYALSRLCGEGTDRQDYPGDFRLSRTEIRDILTLAKQYDRFMLVLNTACVVDLTPVYEAVPNILLLSQTGSTIGDSFADVLLGKEYPSGKLAETWAGADDYSYISDFGVRDDVHYREGIYVGYRWFDSAGRKPLFPFGFGLSYTTFDLSCGRPVLEGSVVYIPVNVRNTGEYPGKEVVEVYVSVPYGKLDQPYQILAAFSKTGELVPGQNEKVNISFPMERLSSFDPERCLRILEAGDYILRVGTSSRDTEIAGILRLSEEAVTEHLSHVGGRVDFSDRKISEEERAGCLAAFGEEKDLSVSERQIPVLQMNTDEIRETEHRTPSVDSGAMAIADSMSDDELIRTVMGAFASVESRSIIGDAAIHVAGAAGETVSIPAYDVKGLIMADGPSGLRLSRVCGKDAAGVFSKKDPLAGLTDQEKALEVMPAPLKKAVIAMFPSVNSRERDGEIFEQNCTEIPSASALAQTWNLSAARTCGQIVREEMERFGIQIWLAPAMNIKRHPLCGRSFEYYSEDPLVSGLMAAAITEGVQEKAGFSVTVKHFCCNNQEANRFRTNSCVSERALRDLYCRGFETAVKEGHPHAVMSSYNLLNGVHTSERVDLIRVMLREEWGFEGIVMSDFMTGDESASDQTNKYRKFMAPDSLSAGLDLVMPGGRAHYDRVRKALEEGSLNRNIIKKAAARMIAYDWKLQE